MNPLNSLVRSTQVGTVLQRVNKFGTADERMGAAVGGKWMRIAADP